MGIVKGIFASNISGKVGNVVFRKNGRDNVVSQRPANVKNPRSVDQMIQRALIKSVASAYSVLRPLCDHSFEGVSFGGKCMQHFNKINYPVVKAANQAVFKNSSGLVVPLPFKIASGSIHWAGYADGDAGFPEMGHLDSFMTKNNIADITKLTCKQFLDAMGLQNGDQITLVTLVLASTEPEKWIQYGDKKQAPFNLHYSRYIINDIADEAKQPFLQEVVVSEEFKYYTINSAYLAKESQINDYCKLGVQYNSVGIVPLPNNNTMTLSSDINSVIISRKNGDTWQRSDAYLYVDGVLGMLKDAGATYDMVDVLPSYDPTKERYLNNADK